MKKSLFEQVSITYRQEGDYILPNLAVPESTPVSIWGQHRKRHLREHRGPLYTALLFSGKLDAHLADIDQQAQEMYSWLVDWIAEWEGITEQLKAANQMEWVRRMNNIRNRAEEIIFNEYIYR